MMDSRRSYTPISFYKVNSSSSVVNKYPGPIKKGNKVSLSSYNTTVVYKPDESEMDIFLPKPTPPYDRRKYRQLWYYFYRDNNPAFKLPGDGLPCERNRLSIPGVRINRYFRASITPTLFTEHADHEVAFDYSDDQSVFGSSQSSPQSSESESKSDESKVIFSCFGSSHSSSESKVIFGSFGCQTSETKKVIKPSSSSASSSSSRNLLSKNKKRSSNSESSNFIFGSFPFAFRSSSSDSNLIFTCFGKPKVIPDKLAFSILSKLSIKSLKRFGCVRTSWSILFQNAHFMTMYATHFISRHGSHDDYHTFINLNSCADTDLYYSHFYLLKNNIPPLNFSHPLQRSTHRTCILGSTSVNGIFCIGQSLPIFMPDSRYTLWNPLTQEIKKVPPSPAVLPVNFDGELFLQYYFHGFGYDKRTDDFKILQYVSFDDMFDRRTSCMPTAFIEIYNLKSNSWRMIHIDKDLCHRRYSFKYSSAFCSGEVYVDGACHWLILGPTKINHHLTPIGVSLLSFDFSDEVFVTTPIGEEIFSPCSRHHRLTVLNGSIALISNYHKDVDFHISILGELGVGESWIKLYTCGPLPCCICWPPIGFGKMGYMFVQVKNRFGHEVACVDLITQIIEELGIVTHGQLSIVGLYKESHRMIK